MNIQMDKQQQLTQTTNGISPDTIQHRNYCVYICQDNNGIKHNEIKKQKKRKKKKKKITSGEN